MAADTEKDRAQHQKDKDQRGPYGPERPPPLGPGGRFLRAQAGGRLGVQEGIPHREENVQPRKDQPRENRAQVKLPHGLVSHQAVDDGQDAGGNQDAQGPPSHHRSHGQNRAIAPAEHGREGHQGHGHHRRPDNPHHGREDGRGHHRGHGQPPRDPAQPFVGHVKNLLYDPRFFQHGGHEDEKGDGGEEVLGHVVPDPLGHQGQGVGAPEPGDEDHGKPPDQKGQGVAGEEKDKKGPEHQPGEGLNRHGHPRGGRRVRAGPKPALASAGEGPLKEWPV